MQLWIVLIDCSRFVTSTNGPPPFNATFNQELTVLHCSAPHLDQHILPRPLQPVCDRIAQFGLGIAQQGRAALSVASIFHGDRTTPLGLRLPDGSPAQHSKTAFPLYQICICPRRNPLWFFAEGIILAAQTLEWLANRIHLKTTPKMRNRHYILMHPADDVKTVGCIGQQRTVI